MRNSDLKSLAIQAQFPQPLQLQNRATYYTKQDYFSLLCRNGPLPDKYHRQTDILCLLAYLILLIGMVVLVILNGINQQKFTYLKEDELKKDLLFGQKFFLWEIIFSSCGVMVLSLIMCIFALYIPKVMSLFSIILLLLLCIFFTVIEIKRFFQNKQRIFMYLLKAIISILILIIILIMFFKRKDKLINLGLFLQLSSNVIKPHICLVFTQFIILSVFQLLIWFGFATIYYGLATIKYIPNYTINTIAKLIVAVMWLWTSGALIALSDYIITSYTVHWFYNLSRAEDFALNQLKNFYSSIQERQINLIYSRNNRFTSQVFTPIYKSLCSQIGTVIFGSILAYLPLYLIAKIHMIIFKSSTKEYGITTFSKYVYLDTVMEWQGFINANHRIYKLRNRIKSVMPELYMMGSFYGDFTKLALIMIGLGGISELVELKSDIGRHDQFWLQYSFAMLMFGFGIGLQIATNFTNLIGKCGDIAFFLYCIDLQIERVHFLQNTNYSTPKALWQILRQLTIKRQWKQEY